MKHLTIDQIQPEDYRFIEKADASFSPQKNYAVIRDVIDDGMKISRVMRDAQRKDTEMRIDVLSTYARHSLSGGEKTLEQYMGREWMAKIYGEKIMEKIRVMDSVKRLNQSLGNTKYKDFYLT